MSGARVIKPGQVWRHVGSEEVEATGLLIRVLRIEPPYAITDYPQFPEKGERRRYLLARSWDYYELAVSPDEEKVSSVA